MKKLLVILLALTLVLAMAACGKDDKTPDTPEGGVDLSAYPASFNDWTADDITRYFTEAGVIPEGEAFHVGPEEYAGTAFHDYIGYSNEIDLTMITIWILDPDHPSVPELRDYIRENHSFDESYHFIPVDHLVGNVVFWYSTTVDEDAFNAIETAYNDLVAGMGVTPDF